MPAWFVTATGTDIGKTFVMQGLIRTMRQQGRAVDALKPIVSGFTRKTAAESDPGILLQALDQPITDDTLARVSPWRFKAPLSPNMAAEKEGRVAPFDELITHCHKAIADSKDTSLLIEGVGGVMVPLVEGRTVVDWIIALRIPVVLVTGSYLGALSHTFTAIEALQHRAIPIAAVVVSETMASTVPLPATVETIAKFVKPINVIAMPRLAAPKVIQRAFGDLAQALI